MPLTEDDIKAFHSYVGAPDGTLTNALHDIVREMAGYGLDDADALRLLREWYADAPELFAGVSLSSLALTYGRPRAWVMALWAERHTLRPDNGAVLQALAMLDQIARRSTDPNSRMLAEGAASDLRRAVARARGVDRA